MNASVKIDNPELVIGLVGPIGVQMDAVVAHLKNALDDVEYESHVIHITSVMGDLLPGLKVKDSTYHDRYYSLIENADRVRREAKNQAALACLAISEIRNLREEFGPEGMEPEKARNQPLLQTAFIIRQFKREEEITLLREVYGRKFILVSVYSDPEERRRQLMRKIKGHGTTIIEDDEAEKIAIDLIARDHNEIGDDYGQRVSDVFHLGDVFVPGGSGAETKEVVDRFIRAFFGHNGLSPTKGEYGMYAAAGAALRSLDLSRQIGAAVFSQQGEVITLGCNEVPKAFGGTYWCDDPGEQHRDFEEGEDGNHSRKLRLLHDLIERLGKLGYVSEDLKKAGPTAIQVKKLVSEKLISDSKIMDIIEFGRIIHAEMSAITDAARKGKALQNAILFTTTFPCHMCAKHIVSSGIRKVVFLEPYPKSHAKDLHSDSITFSSTEADAKVLFEPFIGISPRRYRDIFEKKKRKDSAGKAQDWSAGKPVPRLEDRGSSYIDNEEPAISLVVKEIAAFRVRLIEASNARLRPASNGRRRRGQASD
ncbi:anti-phage dCTP deaminase [Sinorhizobium glycinis]|uniref:anti-phage dCTP deaminase n=1 Tax=Sinorhizobium glycinis TaxID=1472378 RepID=UPI0009EDAAEB|nr:anti-phage dCTP deaminase [Sinorhizobium glycinis]